MSWGPPLAIDMERNSQRPPLADGLCSDSHAFFVVFVLFLIPDGTITKIKTHLRKT